MDQLLLFLYLLARWIGLILGIGCISLSNILFIIMQFANLNFYENVSKTKKIIKLIFIFIVGSITIVFLISSIVHRSWELAFTATAINFIQTLFYLRI